TTAQSCTKMMLVWGDRVAKKTANGRIAVSSEARSAGSRCLIANDSSQASAAPYSKQNSVPRLGPKSTKGGNPNPPATLCDVPTGPSYITSRATQYPSILGFEGQSRRGTHQ